MKSFNLLPVYTRTMTCLEHCPPISYHEEWPRFQSFPVTRFAVCKVGFQIPKKYENYDSKFMLARDDYPVVVCPHVRSLEAPREWTYPTAPVRSYAYNQISETQSSSRIKALGSVLLCLLEWNGRRVFNESIYKIGLGIIEPCSDWRNKPRLHSISCIQCIDPDRKRNASCSEIQQL